MNEEIQTMTHDLYRHFDAKGNLLYVGVSLSAVQRLQQHKNQANWYNDVARIQVEKFPSRPAVLRAERIAIRKEKPLYNISGTPNHQASASTPGVSHDATARLDAEYIESSLGLVCRQLWYKKAEAAKILDVSVHELISLYESGRIAGFSWNHTYTPTQGVDKGKERSRIRYKFSCWQLLDYLKYLHEQAEAERQQRETKCS